MNKFTSQQARNEAERCLQCFDAPCTAACPAHIDIPSFIAMIKSRNVRGAAEIVKTSNALANVCGAVCPEEIFCQSDCSRGRMDTPIAIRELHSFATEYEQQHGYSRPAEFPVSAKNVAVIGGGPAGLACAFELAKSGCHVTVFDRRDPGGVPKNSIPSFRLSEKELNADLHFLSRYCVIVKESIDEHRLLAMKKDFDALFLAVGLAADKSAGIPGESFLGVVPVIQFLEESKSKFTKKLSGKKVVIIGGGNVSLDAAATAKRLGASEVTLLYRRSENEMRVWKSEYQEARSQGADIRMLTLPVEITGTGSVNGVRCLRTRLSDKKDFSGRFIPVAQQGTDHLLPADLVIVAIGQEVPPDAFRKLLKDKKGYVTVDQNYQTSEKGIFAGGDVIGGEGTIVQSVAQGKHAAQAIRSFLAV